MSPTDCLVDPSLSYDGAWLIFGEDTGCRLAGGPRMSACPWDGQNADCSAKRLLPEIVGTRGGDSGQLLDGRHVGRPDAYLFVFSLRGSFPSRGDLRTALLDKSSFDLIGNDLIFTELLSGNASNWDPRTTWDGRRLVYRRIVDGQLSSNRLHETQGDPTDPSSFPAGRAMDELGPQSRDANPTLSPDGRVLVFSRGPDRSQVLMMARRQAVDLPFEPPVQVDFTGTVLDGFPGLVSDPNFTPTGDLLLSSTRNATGVQRLYLMSLQP